MIQVTENVFVESNMIACNVGFLTTKEGVVMIDTPMRPTDAVKWRDEAGRRGEIRYLINTEEHPDHWQTDWFFPGALITHQETRDKLKREKLEDTVGRMKRMDPEGVSLIEGYQLRLADITFNESLNLYMGDHTIMLFSLPGHSTGGIGVYIPEERVVFTTDIVFHHWKSWLHESVPSDWLNSLKRLSDLDPKVVVPGHGDICTKDYLDEQANIIRQWVEVVQSAINKGMSKEEAIAQISCPDPYPKQPNTPFSEPEVNGMIVARLFDIYSR